MNFFNPQQRRLFAFDTSRFPDVTEGRVGFRQMFTRSSRYSNIRISVRPTDHVSGFYNKDQQDIIEALFWGMYSPDWHDRIKKQLQGDAGGYGKEQSIAIFGMPGSGKFEFVMTGRHLTIRAGFVGIGDSSSRPQDNKIGRHPRVEGARTLVEAQRPGGVPSGHGE